MDIKEQVKNFEALVKKIKDEIRKDVVGQEDVIDNVLIAIISGGNVLLEGIPGVGKTRLVRSLGQALNLPFSRIQFTPDLMPYDVTGTNIIEKDDNGKMKLTFQKGPIFSNIVLADEINRATPKTQSAMLEAMQEHKVTIANVTYKLDEPFFVLATENPVEQDGTYPLPEAQMDRFMFKLIMEFPNKKELKDIVTMTQVTLSEQANPIINGNDILEYTMNLVTKTHNELKDASEIAKKYLRFGASPRAAQALITGAKVRALMNGNYNVSYDDIDALAYPVLRHRIKINYDAISEHLSNDDVITLLIKENRKEFNKK